MIVKPSSLYVTTLELITLNKILTTSITSIIAIFVLTLGIANPVVASVEDEEDDSGEENYDPRNDYFQALNAIGNLDTILGFLN